MTPSAAGPLEFDVRADVAEVPRVLATVDDLCAAGVVAEATVFAVKVALDEVLMNVISHAYPEGGEHLVHVRLEVGAGGVRVEVSDDGCPFDPLSSAPPVTTGSLATRSIGGLGVHLVRQLMDEVHYRRAGDRNVLTMTKRSER